MKIIEFFRFVKIKKYVFITSFIISVISTLLSLTLPVYLKNIMDEFENNSIDFQTVKIAILVFIASTVLNSISLYIFKYVGSKSMMNIREEIWEKTLDLNIENLKGIETGEIVSRIRNDIEELNSFMTNTVPNNFNYFLICIGSLVMLFVLDIKITLMILILIPIMSLIIFPIGNITYNIAEKSQNNLSDFTKNISNVLNNFKLVKAYTAEDYEKRNISLILNKIFKLELKEAKIQALISPLMSFLFIGTILLVISYSTFRISQGSLTTGTFVAILYYLLQVIPALLSFTSLYTDYKKATGATNKIKEIINIKKKPFHTEITVPEKIEEIKLTNVSFQYDNQLILNNFSIHLKKGENIALVGPSGAGKTTVFNLIMGFYTSYQGKIEINGVDIKYFDLCELRKKISYVPQENNVMSGTILQNIVYGSENQINMKRLDSACNTSVLRKFIEKAPNSLEYNVGENGSLLSGGQKQRVALCRALYKDADIILLDEFSSNLDSQTESEITSNLKKELDDQICITIAHRLSTIKNSKIILFLENGTITGKGTHDNLYKNHKLYRTFVDSQNLLQKEG